MATTESDPTERLVDEDQIEVHRIASYEAFYQISGIDMNFFATPEDVVELR